MRVLLDTNIVLDALLDREPWNENAKAIWQAHLHGELAAHITANALTDIFYIARRHSGRDQARLAIRACLDQLHVISIGFHELRAAMALAGNDFEDDLQVVCAAAASLDAIVTRDPSGFSSSVVEVLGTQDILGSLSGSE